ncbi:hypothetical protein QLQ85_00170 [Halomonas sp. M4R5S39]|nr:hypothetical protein [Halomonas kalidii]MDI5983190.1 hypothetical protein [Halomonas kalidii]
MIIDKFLYDKGALPWRCPWAWRYNTGFASMREASVETTGAVADGSIARG